MLVSILLEVLRKEGAEAEIAAREKMGQEEVKI